VPLTVPEVRRLLWRVWWLPFHSTAAILRWSHWRRQHQARAKRSHYRRRLRSLAA